MSLLGFDAIGRLAIGQITSGSTSPSVNVSGASGIGVARSLTATESSAPLGAVGLGVVGLLVAGLAIGISGVAALGVAGIASAAVSVTASAAQGTGVGRANTLLEAYALQGVSGGGVAGNLTPSSSTPTVPGVAGIGVAGTLTANPSSISLHAVGTGLAGRLLISVSGGGGSGPVRRDPRMRTGFEPIKKVYRAPDPPAPEPKIKPPPQALVRAARSAPIVKPPAPLIDQRLMPDISALIQKIVDAEAASRRQRQDEQDIAEIIAFLEAQDKQT